MSEPITPPPPPATEPAPPSGGGSSNTLMLVLSYLGILALIPLLVEKDDAEVQWHAKHGIVLLLMWVAVGIVFTILANVPVLGCLAVMVSLIVPMIALVVHIICIVKAVNGQRFLIPGVSQYADKF